MLTNKHFIISILPSPAHPLQSPVSNVIASPSNRTNGIVLKRAAIHSEDINTTLYSLYVAVPKATKTVVTIPIGDTFAYDVYKTVVTVATSILSKLLSCGLSQSKMTELLQVLKNT